VLGKGGSDKQPAVFLGEGECWNKEKENIKHRYIFRVDIRLLSAASSFSTERPQQIDKALSRNTGGPDLVEFDYRGAMTFYRPAFRGTLPGGLGLLPLPWGCSRIYNLASQANWSLGRDHRQHPSIVCGVSPRLVGKPEDPYPCLLRPWLAAVVPTNRPLFRWA